MSLPSNKGSQSPVMDKNHDVKANNKLRKKMRQPERGHSENRRLSIDRAGERSSLKLQNNGEERGINMVENSEVFNEKVFDRFQARKKEDQKPKVQLPPGAAEPSSLTNPLQKITPLYFSSEGR